jgi:superfamily II DNA/RNA helicase
VDVLVRRFLPKPVLVALDPEASPITTMTHHAFETADRDTKLELLTELAGGLGRTLLFVRTKHGADRLAKQLGRGGVPAAALHGGMAQGARLRALRSFAGGSCRVLVATDVAARGIHVDDVDLVVHADPPTEPKAYLHRSGRTARAGAAGAVVVVCVPAERPALEGLLRAAGVGGRPVAVRSDDPLVRDLVGPSAPRIAPTATPAPQASRPATPGRPGRRPRPDGGGAAQASQSYGRSRRPRRAA